MKLKILFLVTGFVVNLTSGADFIKVDTSLDPNIVNQNQVFLNKKERFIKFDTKDNELEIELGISIPFIKVPLTTGRQMYEGGGESKIAVNAPGLLVAGMLMLTSFIVVPLLFSTTSDSGFGFQRKVEESNVWSVVEGVNEALFKSGIDSSSCMKKSICWITKTSKSGKDGSIGKWVDYFLRTWWMSRLIGGTAVEEAVKSATGDASCEAKYSQCSVSNKQLKSFAKIIASGRHS